MRFDFTYTNDNLTINTTGAVEGSTTFQVEMGKVFKGDKGDSGTASYSPKIDSGTNTWWTWNDTTQGYIDTGIKAESTDLFLKKTNVIIYNITNEIPLPAGQYYTLATAIAAIPTNIRKLGLKITFQVSATNTETWEFFNGTIGNITNTIFWRKTSNSADLDLKIDKNSIKQVLGTSTTDLVSQKAISDLLIVDNFTQRVLADGGKIHSSKLLEETYLAHKDLLPNTKILLMPEVGVKTRISESNEFINKLYDLSSNNNDAVQATEANQPYLGNIPVGKYKLYSQNSNIRLPLTTTISFTNTETWSFVCNVKLKNFGWSTLISSGTSRVRIYIGEKYAMFFIDNSLNLKYFSIPCNKTSNINFNVFLVCRGNNATLYINGIAYETFDVDTSIIINNILSSSSSAYSLAGDMNYLSIFNKALSATEIANLNTFLTSTFEDIPSAKIGYQSWELHNFDSVIDGLGNTIANVTDNETWADSTNIYNNTVGTELDKLKAAAMWCYYNNDVNLGTIYDKEYNDYARALLKLNPPIGWRVEEVADYTQLSSYLLAKVGMKLKAKYNIFINNYATNETGFSLLANGYRNELGVFAGNNDYGVLNIGGTIYKFANDSVDVVTIGTDRRIGAGIRLLKTSPNGEVNIPISSGYFTTNIAAGTANKDLTDVPFGYKVTEIIIKSDANLTNVAATLYSTVGVSQATLFTGESVTANIPNVFNCLVDQAVQYTNPFVRINATGNVGMEVIINLQKILL